MAAPMKIEQLIFSSCQRVFESKSVELKRISVQRKSSRFELGDFVIPQGCLAGIDEKLLFELKVGILNSLTAAGVPVARLEIVKGDTHSLALYLDRTVYCREVIHHVTKEGLLYSCKDKQDAAVLFCNNNNSCYGDIGLDYLRSLVLQEHCSKLLQSHGYTVYSYIPSLESENVVNLLSNLGTDTTDVLPGVDETTSYSYSQSLLTSRFVSRTTQLESELEESVQPGTGDTSHASESSSDDKELDKQSAVPETLEFNLKDFICVNSLSVGKSNFDKNLSLCTVFRDGRPTDTVVRAAAVCHCLKEKSVQKCVHISRQSGAFTSQKLHLIVQQMLELEDRKVLQKHFVYGPVRTRQDCEGTDISSAEDFFRLRYAQLRQAAVMKYGEGVHGEGWAATLEALTAACIKFELLSCVHRNTLKLNLSNEDMEGQSTCNGAFVMYNCARLATLFKHFQEAVDNEVYPPLPPVEQIDFTCLREEAEWSLLFNYVDTFPDLVQSSVENIDNTDSIHVQIHTHKVCHMLGSLSRSLSSYYSRYHVLGEARSQLLPTMYARLYLLKAVHQVMINGLSLMGIRPLSQL